MLFTIIEQQPISDHHFLKRYLTSPSPLDEIIYRVERSALYCWKEHGLPAFLQLIEFIIMRNLRKPFQSIDKQVLQIYLPHGKIAGNLVNTIRENMVYSMSTPIQTPWNVKSMINTHFFSSRSYEILRQMYLKKLNNVYSSLNEILKHEPIQLRTSFNLLLKQLYL